MLGLASCTMTPTIGYVDLNMSIGTTNTQVNAWLNVSLLVSQWSFLQVALCVNAYSE